MTAHVSRDLRPFAERALIAILLIQGLLCLFAVADRVMLYADGARFTFGVALGAPWPFAWADKLSRLSTYVLTVAPTAMITRVLPLGGEGIAAVYGLFFYGVPLLQWLAIGALGRRYGPQLLIFPVVQYALSSSLIFGFPTEIALAPGFFWICLFYLMRPPGPVSVPAILAFTLSFAGLAFSHEAAVPAALLVTLLTYRQRRSSGQPFSFRAHQTWLQLISAAILLGWIAIRVSTPSDADSNTLYVIDPRKVLNNPTLWVLTASGSLGAAIVWGRNRPLPQKGVIALFLIALLLPVLLQPWLNFAQGRYEARSFVALALLVLGVAFMAASRTLPAAPPAIDIPRAGQTLSAITVLALGLTTGASLVFLGEWRTARAGFKNVVNAEATTGAPAFVPYARAARSMTPRARKANDRMEFGWTWPYRAIDLAPDYRPRQIIFDPAAADSACPSRDIILGAKNSLIPASTRTALVAFACARPAPKITTRSARFFRALKAFLRGGDPP